MPEPSYRLPRTVEPRRYDLVLAPDIPSATFTGTARIEIDVVEAVDAIVLNAIELEISSAVLESTEGRVLDGTVTLDDEEQQATITLPETIPVAAYVLNLSFSGTLNDKLRGFYRSTFKDDGGVEHVIATTQFEATDARRAFPCWDEPDRKAVFGVTLEVAEDLLALSNGGVVSDEAIPPEEGGGDGRRRVRFADTMPMSTYLVAFVVGPLHITDAVDVDGVPLRVACVPGKAHLASFALDVGAHSLRFFTEYFGIPYPSDKLDLVALPDFAAGAMENLGCVTFRETALLVDESHASKTDLQRVADVVAHEIAHMWFGDLVTMKWWNGIWLNEAFATFMEMLCVDAYRPEWERWVTFGRSRAAAMIIDGLAATRTIEFPVGRPEEADAMFDVLTYEKGAAVLRMLEQYLGPDAFRDGVRSYLKAHEYGNTETNDLWDALEAATGQPARSTMDSWIFQEGYPVITVEADGSSLQLEQHRFRSTPDDSDPTRWQVPVLVRSGTRESEAKHTRTLLQDGTGSVDLGAKPDWVVVNDGGSGFYRVRYSADLLHALTEDMGGRLSALERLHLVNDTWASVVTGLTSLSDYLALAHLPDDEDDPNVWWSVADSLGFLSRLLEGDDRDRYRAWARGILRAAFDRLTWDLPADADEKAGPLRANLAIALGTWAADEEVRAEARQRFASGNLAPDLEPAAVMIVAASGGEADYEELARRWRQPATPQEETRCLYALGDFADPALIARTLDLLLTEVRTQNAAFLLLELFGNEASEDAAWSWFESHIDECLARFPSSSVPRAIHDYYNAKMANGVTGFRPPLAARARTFLEGRDDIDPGGKKVDQGLERMAVNLTFRARETPGLVAFVRSL